jgi:carboxypeptidase PM20D1
MSPTMFHAGMKDNVLPRSASAIVNFRYVARTFVFLLHLGLVLTRRFSRIKPGETRESVEAHVRAAIGDDRVKLTRRGLQKDASAVSSTTSPGWAILESAIHDICPACRVAPYVTPGATDGRYFHPVSDSVYRFAPMVMQKTDLTRFHGTNERVHKSDVLSGVLFYKRLLERGFGAVTPEQKESHAHRDL